MKLLNSIRPTQTQLKILAIITASQDTPARAAAEISKNQNLITARNILMKLGIIHYNPNNVQLTQTGTQLAIQQNIIDDTGSLTEEGARILGLDNNQQDNLTQIQTEGFSQLFKELIRL